MPILLVKFAFLLIGGLYLVSNTRERPSAL
jgi:hypothetical protein